MPKLCPNITFPHQQDFFPIRSVTKSSTARFSHENLVEKFKIFVQDFVPIRTALSDMDFVEDFLFFHTRYCVQSSLRFACNNCASLRLYIMVRRLRRYGERPCSSCLF